MEDTLLAVKGLSIKQDNESFGVFVNATAVDWFGTYNEAAKLFEDLCISRKASEDPMIGAVKYCPADFGNGMLVVVVAKVKDGYLVQPAGSSSENRFEVTAEFLSEPPQMLAE